MNTKKALLITLVLLAGCGAAAPTGESAAALIYPVKDGGACALGEIGCNGLGTAIYACVADQPGESHWGSPTLCPLGCVSAAPSGDGLERDYCAACAPGTRRIESVDNECVQQTCTVARQWGAAQPFRCPPGFALDQSTCTCSCISPKCQQNN